MSQTTSRIYYIEVSTGHSTYKHPLGLGAASQLRLVDHWASRQDQFRHLPGLPLPYVYGMSKGTGQHYYINVETGETSYALPFGVATKEPTIGDAARTMVMQWVDKQDQFSHLPTLPAGWLYGISKGRWRDHYVNASTGEISQRPPPGVAARERGDERTADRSAIAAGLGSGNRDLFPDPAQLPEGWQYRFSKSYGDICYINEATGETTYEAPAEPDGGNDCPSPARHWLHKQEQFSDLPEPPKGWIYGLSMRTEQPYYIEVATGRTMYSAPEIQ